MLHIRIRIDSINPVHTRLTIFTNSKRNGITTPAATGSSGQLVVDTELLEQFLDRMKPTQIITTKLSKGSALIPRRWR